MIAAIELVGRHCHGMVGEPAAQHDRHEPRDNEAARAEMAEDVINRDLERLRDGGLDGSDGLGIKRPDSPSGLINPLLGRGPLHIVVPNSMFWGHHGTRLERRRWRPEPLHDWRRPSKPQADRSVVRHQFVFRRWDLRGLG